MSRWLVLMRLLIAVVALFLALVFAIVFDDPLAWIIAYFILFVMVYEVLHRVFARAGVKVSRQILNPARGSVYRITAGDPLEVVTRVDISGWGRICFVRWHHVCADIADEDAGLSGACFPWSKSPRVFADRVRHLNRGEHEIGRMEWDVADVFGLQVLSGQSDILDKVIVHPRRYAISNWDPFALAESGVLKTRWQSAALEAQGYFSGVREYRHGDRISQVHWPATAHRNRMMSKEIPTFEKPTIAIVLETCGTFYGPSSRASVNARFDWAVSVFASLVQQAVSRNSSVIVAYPREGKLWQARVGMDRLSSIMDGLAQVDRTSETFVGEHLRFLQMDAPSQVIVVSPKWSETYHEALSGRHAGAVEWIVPLFSHEAVEPDVGESLRRFSDLGLRHECLLARKPKGKGHPIRLQNCR